MINMIVVMMTTMMIIIRVIIITIIIIINSNKTGSRPKKKNCYAGLVSLVYILPLSLSYPGAYLKAFTRGFHTGFWIG